MVCERRFERVEGKERDSLMTWILIDVGVACKA